VRSIFVSMVPLVLLLCSHLAEARQDTRSPVRFGSKSVKVDMSESAVREIAGEPTEVINLQNRYGATYGKKLIYRIKGYNKRTVVIVLEDGMGVVGMDECMGVKADACK